MATARVILISGLNKKQLLDAFTNHTTSRYCREASRLVIHFSKVESLSLTPNRKPCNRVQQTLSKKQCHEVVFFKFGSKYYVTVQFFFPSLLFLWFFIISFIIITNKIKTTITIFTTSIHDSPKVRSVLTDVLKSATKMAIQSKLTFHLFLYTFIFAVVYKSCSDEIRNSVTFPLM